MKKLFSILLFVALTASQAQTWVMQYDHKLLPQQEYVVDSIIGNGNTLYFQCGSKLTIKRYAERVKFATMRYSYESCKPFNVIKVGKNIKAVKVVYPKKCIKIETI